MNIHEYQAKKIFEYYNIPINEGIVVSSAEEARKAAASLKGKGNAFVVKAQVHAGGRGKGGGVKLTRSEEEVAALTEKLIGTQLVTPQTGKEGKPVNQVLIESTTEIEKEYYASVVLDRSRAQLCLIVSEAGGMDIEEVAQTQPEKIIKIFFFPEAPLEKNRCEEAAAQLVKNPEHQKSFSKIFYEMTRLFIEQNASLIEINPLAVMKSGAVIAIDAKINFDDHGLSQHPDLMQLHDPSQEDDREVEAKKFDLSYVGLDGNIGCIVNGAGLAMATMDIIKYAGGDPANFLDVGGGASKEKVTAAFKIILRDPKVQAVLVNIFGGIMRCDIVAEGVLAAIQELNKTGELSKRALPIVVRLEGTNVEKGKEILKNSDLKIISATTFEEAAHKVVEVVS